MERNFLSLEERLYIKESIDKRFSNNRIARDLKRAGSTISNEINKNGGRKEYDPHGRDERKMNTLIGCKPYSINQQIRENTDSNKNNSQIIQKLETLQLTLNTFIEIIKERL